MAERPAEDLSIIVVDDHDVVHWGFKLLLSKQPWVASCSSASSSEEALALIREGEVDVAHLQGDRLRDAEAGEAQEVDQDAFLWRRVAVLERGVLLLAQVVDRLPLAARHGQPDGWVLVRPAALVSERALRLQVEVERTERRDPHPHRGGGRRRAELVLQADVPLLQVRLQVGGRERRGVALGAPGQEVPQVVGVGLDRPRRQPAHPQPGAEPPQQLVLFPHPYLLTWRTP